jgi:low temperature requirement protein LtrA
MVRRSPDEEGRSSTPLELFFDLVFVVAIAQVASGLHHAIVDGHAAQGILNYCMVFIAIWWAWINFTWFATTYDTDDVLHRLVVIVQLAGALILAAGVPSAFATLDYTILTIGYAIMRLAIVSEWLRAARNDPEHAQRGRKMAFGIAVLQLFWIGRLFLPEQWAFIGFFVLIGLELAVPAWASSKTELVYHAEHIAERYGLLTIIVLGESILAASLAIQTFLEAGGTTVDAVPTLLGGFLIVVSLFWLYFDTNAAEVLTSVKRAFIWGYGHYFIYAAGAAVGAGIAVEMDFVSGAHPLHSVPTGLSVAIPTAIFLFSMWWLQFDTRGRGIIGILPPIVTAGILLTSFGPEPVLVIGLLLAGLVAATIVHNHKLAGSA